LCSENVEIDTLLAEFEAVTQQLDEVLKDLEWRKPDVEAEEAKLKQLIELEKKGGCHDVVSQAIVVRVLRGVLNDKIAEAERLEKRMNELEKEIKARTAPAAKPEKGGKRGKAISKEKDRMG